MRILYIILFIIISTNSFAELYTCEYKKLNQIKNISFDRVSHSHFQKCTQDKCDEKKYSVVFANNDHLIIGDVIEKEDSSFLLFIINKNTNLFSAANIKFPYSDIDNEYFTGKCEKKD